MLSEMSLKVRRESPDIFLLRVSFDARTGCAVLGPYDICQ